MLVASPPQGPVDPASPRESSPAAAAFGTPVCRGSPVSHHASDEEKPPLIPLSRTGHPGGDVPEEEIEVAIVVANSDDSHASVARRKKKDGFSNKIQILEFGGKKDTLKM